MSEIVRVIAKAAMELLLINSGARCNIKHPEQNAINATNETASE